MKKSFFIAIGLSAVLFFVSTSEAQAQWAIEVSWNDSNCECAAITLKTLEWGIYNEDGSTLLYSGSVDVTNLSSPQVITGSDIITPDQRYLVCARVNYYEASVLELCCTGYQCVSTDSDELTNTQDPVSIPLISMN